MADTTPQEQTSAWIFRRALKENKKYKSAQDILADPKFQKEVIGDNRTPGIYQEVNSDWIENYYKQQKKFLEEFSDAKFSEFTRDGGFMDFITKLVNKKYGISKKDYWDPADIWCIQNERKVISDISKIIDANKREPEAIEKLNTLLRTLFKERIVVGISLKQVGPNQGEARYQEVNMKKGVLFVSGKKPYFEFFELNCDLVIMQSGNKEGSPTADGSSMKVVVNYTKEKVQHTFGFRPKTPKGPPAPMNLTFSFQAKGEKGQVGAIPVHLMIKKMQDTYQLSFSNAWQDYPNTSKDFRTHQKMYVDIFNKVKGKVNTGIRNEKDFVTNIITMLSNNKSNRVGISKLMQLKFYSKFLSLNETRQKELMADLFFLAEKRGEGFGPFGKIY
jgi:hypothetical protein